MYTSGFVDDVISAHKPMLLDVAAQVKCSCTRSLGLGYKMCALIPVAGQRMHGTTSRALKVTSQVATTGAKSVLSTVPSPPHCAKLSHHTGSVGATGRLATEMGMCQLFITQPDPLDNFDNQFN